VLTGAGAKDAGEALGSTTFLTCVRQMYVCVCVGTMCVYREIQAKHAEIYAMDVEMYHHYHHARVHTHTHSLSLRLFHLLVAGLPAGRHIKADKNP